MHYQNILWLIIGSFFVPTLATVGMAYVMRWRRQQSPPKERSPVSEKLLRPAGESLRLKIDELSETFSNQLSHAMTFPGAILASVLLSSTDGSISQGRAWIAFGLCAALLAWLLRRAFQTRAKLSNYQLGFHGERAVAEELNQLMREGCQVFHDLPMEPCGNIDHVIVSPAGVFAVETKMRRKRPAPKGKRPCDVVFDGETVHFPSWEEKKMVQQTRTQAQQLATLLTKAVGESVTVKAVLTLPGWFVTRSVRAENPYFLNSKEIASVVLDSRTAKLTPEMMNRISYQLEQKCRTVEL